MGPAVRAQLAVGASGSAIAFAFGMMPLRSEVRNDAAQNKPLASLVCRYRVERFEQTALPQRIVIDDDEAGRSIQRRASGTLPRAQEKPRSGDRKGHAMISIGGPATIQRRRRRSPLSCATIPLLPIRSSARSASRLTRSRAPSASTRS
jgi:hypothetical protein